MRRCRVEVQIGELVLDGFAPFDGGLVGEAFEGELARLLGRQGVTSLHRDLHMLDAGSIELGADGDARRLGSKIAVGVYRSLTG